MGHGLSFQERIELHCFQVLDLFLVFAFPTHEGLSSDRKFIGDGPQRFALGPQLKESVLRFYVFHMSFTFGVSRSKRRLRGKTQKKSQNYYTK
jgi:hypothetical protein